MKIDVAQELAALYRETSRDLPRTYFFFAEQNGCAEPGGESRVDKLGDNPEELPRFLLLDKDCRLGLTYVM
jgi:hypothetical protein